MEKDPFIFIEHIFESIKIINDYTRDKSFNDFKNSIQLQDSVIRRLEIIGEAIQNIPHKIRDKYEKIPWREIAGLRDILIHQYFGIDLELTWEVIKTDLPELDRNIKTILDNKRKKY